MQNNNRDIKLFIRTSFEFYDQWNAYATIMMNLLRWEWLRCTKGFKAELSMFVFAFCMRFKFLFDVSLSVANWFKLTLQKIIKIYFLLKIKSCSLGVSYHFWLLTLKRFPMAETGVRPVSLYLLFECLSSPANVDPFLKFLRLTAPLSTDQTQLCVAQTHMHASCR